MFKRKLKETEGTPKTMMERPFWRFFGALGDFFILTVYWLIGSLPIVTIGVSTTALFYVCLKKRRNEEGTLWRMFKKSYRENLKQGVFLWLLYVFIALDACIIGYMLIQSGRCALADFQSGGRFYIALAVVELIYISVMLYSAALLSLFRQTTGQLIVSAIGLAFNQLPSTILFLLILAALWLATFYLFPALIFIDIPLAVYLISIRMNAIFNRQIQRAEARNRAE